MIEVTDEMVTAARRQIPERCGLGHLRDAIVAALDAAPRPVEHLVDLRYSDEDIAIMVSGIEGSGVRDATGSLATIPVNHPAPHPALNKPLVLGGITEIATKLSVARSTVVGWTRRAEKIGMPAPLGELAAGPVYDLVAVADWHRAWKNTAGDADAAE